MISCCAGAELQVRRRDGARDEEIVLRELYPTNRICPIARMPCERNTRATRGPEVGRRRSLGVTRRARSMLRQNVQERDDDVGIELPG